MDLLQLIGVNINAFIQNPIVAHLLSGAAEGVVVGLITGALVWSVNKAPDALGRGILLAVLFGVVGFIAEFVRIISVTGHGMGEMIAAFSENPDIGPMFLNAFIRTAFYMLLGAVIGIGFRAPQFMIRGTVIGIFFGGLVGAILWLLTNYYLGFSLNIVIFRFLVVLGVWGLITVFSSK
jgi:hypothetical protein